MSPESRPAWIHARLSEVFSPEALAVHDDSYQHAGHASAGGGGHFRVNLTSAAFAGKRTLERHRLVYAAVQEAISSGDIHALQIDAKAPGDGAKR